jgi:hypothetical protein
VHDRVEATADQPARHALARATAKTTPASRLGKLDLFSTRERLTPLSLAAIVERYLRVGAPAPTSLEVEVLVD